MAALSEQQCSALADLWTDYAAALGDYENDHLGDGDLDTDQLKKWIDEAALKGNRFAKLALVQSFNDVDAAFANLQNVIRQARVFTANLKGAVGTWNRFAPVATAMLALAGVCTDPAAAIAGAALNVAKAYTANPDASAADPAPANG
jgi:hypothetical protein